MNSSKIISHFRKFIELSSQDEKELDKFFKSKIFSKKEHLLLEGSRCKYHYFVLTGCLRYTISMRRELIRLFSLLLRIGGLLITMHFHINLMQIFLFKLSKKQR
ncbi:Uncharacterised protein [Sphingobacterium daejeonense]|nr:Uncharacterised protein [Sphingobacterium daejeonense]